MAATSDLCVNTCPKFVCFYFVEKFKSRLLNFHDIKEKYFGNRNE